MSSLVQQKRDRNLFVIRVFESLYALPTIPETLHCLPTHQGVCIKELSPSIFQHPIKDEITSAKKSICKHLMKYGRGYTNYRAVFIEIIRNTIA